MAPNIYDIYIMMCDPRSHRANKAFMRFAKSKYSKRWVKKFMDPKGLWYKIYMHEWRKISHNPRVPDFQGMIGKNGFWSAF